MKYRLTRGYSFGSFAESLAGIEVTIEAREVARADFEPDAVTGQKDIAGCPKINREQIRLAGLHQLRCARGLPIARANDAIEEILRIAVGMHIHQLGGEVGIDCR